MSATAKDQGDKSMGRVAVQVSVSNYYDVLRARNGMLPPEQVRHFEVEGVADTGSSHLVLPPEVADRLGLPKVGEVTIRYADRRSATRPLVDDARVDLLGRQATFQAL